MVNFDAGLRVGQDSRGALVIDAITVPASASWTIGASSALKTVGSTTDSIVFPSALSQLSRAAVATVDDAGGVSLERSAMFPPIRTPSGSVVGADSAGIGISAVGR